MKRVILVLCFLTLLSRLEAQTKLAGTTLHLSGVGAIKYPGIRLGADYPVMYKTIEKSRRKRHKSISKERYLAANLGFYSHKGYNVNVFVQTGYLMQRSRGKGWYTLFEPQIGISRTFIQRAVYRVDNNGTVSKYRGVGDFYFAPAISYGLGKTVTLTTDAKLSLFSKATLFFNYPYNNFIAFRGMFEIGAAYQLAQLLPHSVTLKHKQK